jgi:hypothetical protein
VFTHTRSCALQGQWESYIVETSGSSALGGWQQGRRASSSSTLSGIDGVHNGSSSSGGNALGLRGLHHLRSYVWMSDDDTHKCCGCARQFDLLSRRHHW